MSDQEHDHIGGERRCVTETELDARLSGYVKYKFLIGTMIGVITAPIICTWLLIESHANKPAHEGAVTTQYFTEFKSDYRSDMSDLKTGMNRILDFHMAGKQ